MDPVVIIVIAAGLLFFLVLAVVLSAVLRPKVNLEERISKHVTEEEEEDAVDEKPRKASLIARIKEAAESFFKPLGEVIPRPPSEMGKQERLLVQAGFRRKDAVMLYYGAQFGLAVLLLIVGLAAGFVYWNPALVIPMALLVGWFLPSFVLDKLINARKERLRVALPDALDLAVVCVEAGLGIDQALRRISEELNASYPDLANELSIRHAEINLGRNRVEAFRNLAARTGVDDVKGLVAILIQTERFGTSVGKSLRVFAEAMRVKRQQRAREQAAKMPLKMTFIMMILVFPTVFVVVLGPAIITFIQKLGPALK
jgi:tight adherence protein C